MFRKLFKRFVPKVPEPHEISKKPEIDRVKRQARIERIAYQDASEKLKREIEMNGFAPYLIYEHKKGEHQRDT
ncbi:hypothetical protein [Paenibacillus hunanensis]|uniref:Uncharacterized protein n=1 Tax=Paenibacillus hunanensis TaxID=539262 RepID=A0ABU1IV46_9BACL|nr:hypothetical protein [Paenibacillus hunanensis]MDR6243131.1 hypothetical protein [Paenibacillus hunanensis]GGJ11583.1 hypothetical protein GCM10008022_20940 [Paenibacillus hunanensis]